MADRRDDNDYVDRRGDDRLSPDEVKALKQIARLALTLRLLIALMGAVAGIVAVLIQIKDRIH